jgi:hypothetical protein
MIFLLAGVGAVLALSLYVNWRQSRTNGKLVREVDLLKSSIGAKDAQLKLYANARPGVGVDALGAGTF